MKKIFTAALSLIILVCAIVPPQAFVFADDSVLSGKINDTVSYSYDFEKEELTFSGNGMVEPVVPEDELVWLSKEDLVINYKYYWINCYVRKVIFEDGITGISHELSKYFDRLDSVYLGADFKYNKYDNLYDLYYCNDIEVSENNETLCSKDGVLYSKDMTELIAYPRRRDSWEYMTFIVPSGVKHVYQGAFGYQDNEGDNYSSYNYSKIYHIVFPESVTRIGANYINEIVSVYILNPNCVVEKFFGDEDDFNFSEWCPIYMNGIKDEIVLGSGDDTCNIYHPLIKKNSYYFAFERLTEPYTGKVIKPKLNNILNSKGDFIGTYFGNVKVTVPKKAKKVGTYTATVSIKKGKVKSKFKYKILPSPVKGFKLFKKGKTSTVKWSKHRTQTTGFELEYITTNTRRNKQKRIVIKNNKAVSKTFKTRGDLLIVRIRAYKTVKGKKYYSSWTEINLC